METPPATAVDIRPPPPPAETPGRITPKEFLNSLENNPNYVKFGFTDELSVQARLRKFYQQYLGDNHIVAGPDEVESLEIFYRKPNPEEETLLTDVDNRLNDLDPYIGAAIKGVAGQTNCPLILDVFLARFRDRDQFLKVLGNDETRDVYDYYQTTTLKKAHFAHAEALAETLHREKFISDSLLKKFEALRQEIETRDEESKIKVVKEVEELVEPNIGQPEWKKRKVEVEEGVGRYDFRDLTYKLGVVEQYRQLNLEVIREVLQQAA